jgi:DNA-binding transcriptional ArsR family regulator
VLPKRLLRHLLGGTRGAPLRLRILLLLRAEPMNTNQVAVALGIDYKTAQHHVRVLHENRLIFPLAEGYGAPYRLTVDLEQAWNEVEALLPKEAPHE